MLLSFTLRNVPLNVPVGIEEKGVVVDNLLDDEHELVEIHSVDRGVNALLKGAHGIE
jgi:hypothetical protein